MGSVMYTVQMVSTPPYSLKAATLKTAPTVGTVGRAHILRVGVGEEPPIAWVQLVAQAATTLGMTSSSNVLLR